jgi:hypothetical protein
MSVADPFVYPFGYFPFCVPDLDIDTLDWNTALYHATPVRDLTLPEAMKLYWLLESLSVEIDIDGVLLNDGGGGDTPISIRFDQDLVETAPHQPKQRACAGWPFNAPQGLLGFEATEVEGETIGPWDDGPPGDTLVDVPLVLGYTASPYWDNFDNYPITHQGSDLYTVWLSLTRNGGGTKRRFLFGGPGTIDDPGEIITNLGTAGLLEIPFMSGTMLLRVGLYGGDPQPPTNYRSGTGTVNTFNLTPNFYTFA